MTGACPRSTELPSHSCALIDGRSSLERPPRSSRPLWAKKATGLLPDDRLDVAPRRRRAARIARAVFGTFSGSLTPQSAALFTMMRSVPYFFTSATMRASSIFVYG